LFVRPAPDRRPPRSPPPDVMMAPLTYSGAPPPFGTQRCTSARTHTEPHTTQSTKRQGKRKHGGRKTTHAELRRVSACRFGSARANSTPPVPRSTHLSRSRQKPEVSLQRSAASPPQEHGAASATEQPSSPHVTLTMGPARPTGVTQPSLSGATPLPRHGPSSQAATYHHPSRHSGRDESRARTPSQASGRAGRRRRGCSKGALAGRHDRPR